VAVVGRPNVGKSTLINALLKQKIAAVSPRPQTTRRRQLGVLCLSGAQIVLVDTPGIHVPQNQLGKAMNEAALAALADADCIAWLVDASQVPTEEDRLVAERIKAVPGAVVVLVLNKMDLLSDAQMAIRKAEFGALLPEAMPVGISALRPKTFEPLLEALLARIPEGMPFYDEDQITDLYEREIAADLIREACLLNLDEEIPHAIAVRIDEYKDRSETQSYIAATLLVERESHKAIVIGRNGAMLKKIGTTARQAIEEMSGRKVFLELRVKLYKNWRNDANLLRQLGYKATEESR
jgi:GTP-binding protein Era